MHGLDYRSHFHEYVFGQIFISHYRIGHNGNAAGSLILWWRELANAPKSANEYLFTLSTNVKKLSISLNYRQHSKYEQLLIERLCARCHFFVVSICIQLTHLERFRLQFYCHVAPNERKTRSSKALLIKNANFFVAASQFHRVVSIVDFFLFFIRLNSRNSNYNMWMM